MGATVIDTLIVALNLDPSDYKKNLAEFKAQQKSFDADLKKDKKDGDEAARKSADTEAKRNKATQEANKKTAESFRAITSEVTGLFGVLIGAGSAAAFVGNSVKSMVAVSNAAQLMGKSTKDVAAFGAMIKANNGDANAAIQTMGNLAQVMEGWKFGQAPPPAMLGAMQRIGAQRGDDFMTMYGKFADYAHDTKDKNEVTMFGHRLGMDDDSIREAMKGRSQMSADYAGALKRVPGDEAYKGATQLNTAFTKLGQTMTADGEIVMTKLAPGITKFMRNLGDAMTPNVDREKKVKQDLKDALDDVLHGKFGAAGTSLNDYGHLVGDSWGQLISDRPVDDGGSSGGPSSGGSAAGGSAAQNPALFSGGNKSQAYQIALQMHQAGIPDPVIQGVLRGVAAEGGKFGETDQTDTHGNSAHGIGQWRGPRWAQLKALYGPRPTPQQEVAFLISELKGGDPGGAAVLGAGSSTEAARAYIQSFMRPGAGTGGDLSRAGLYGGSLYGASSGGGGGTNIHVDKIEITTRASDPKAVAHEVRAVLNTRSLTGMANQGLV